MLGKDGYDDVYMDGDYDDDRYAMMIMLPV